MDTPAICVGATDIRGRCREWRAAARRLARLRMESKVTVRARSSRLACSRVRGSPAICAGAVEVAVLPLAVRKVKDVIKASSPCIDR